MFSIYFFYVFLSDTILFAKQHVHFSVPMARREDRSLSNLVSEIRQILNSFGVPNERLQIFLVSDAWKRFISLDKNNLLNFFRAVSLFPNTALMVSPRETKNYFIPANTRFSMAYAIQKFADLFVYTALGKIYPDEIKGNVDLVLIGASGSRLALTAREVMEGEGLISKGYPVFAVFKPIPCFGHTQMVDRTFCIPTWDMTPLEILKIIGAYKLSSERIVALFDSFLNRALREFIVVEKDGRLKGSSSPPVISRCTLFQQRKLLAYNLEAFLKNVRNNLASAKLSGYYLINKKEDIIRFNKILKSSGTFEILALCTGDYTVTEIARKLDRHASNVSRSISRLKDVGFVRVKANGRVEKCVTTLKIDL